MATITTRVQGDSPKGSPLTNAEVDNNFINLNDDKYESGDNINVGTIEGDGLTIDGDTALNGNVVVKTDDNNAFEIVDTASSYRPSVLFRKLVNGVTSTLNLIRSENGHLDFYRDDSGVLRKPLRLDANGDVYVYEDQGTTPYVSFDASTERVTIDSNAASAATALWVNNAYNNVLMVQQEATSLSNDVYTVDVDSSSHASNLTSAGALRVKTTNGNAFVVDGKSDVTMYDNSGNVQFRWDASAPTLALGGAADDTNTDVPFHVANDGSDIDMRVGSLQSQKQGNDAAIRFMGQPDGGGYNNYADITLDPDLEYVYIKDAGRSSGSIGEDPFILTSSGTVLLGKTTTAVTSEGVELRPDGIIAGSRLNNPTGYFTRSSSDGEIVKFYRDSSAVGSIEAYDGSIAFRGNAVATVTTTSTTRIYSLSDENIGVKLVITAHDGTDTSITEILIARDSSNNFAVTQYGQVNTGDQIAEYTVTHDNTNQEIDINATQISTTSTAYRVVSTLF